MAKHAPKSSSKTPALDRLTHGEAVVLLRSLLHAHPELTEEAEALAGSVIGHVSIEDIADEVEAAVDCLDLDDLNSRAGSHSHGYVEPTEAAWELVEETVSPFIEDIQRRAEAGEHDAALNTCAGVVLGLYRLRDRSRDEFLGWAVDSPPEFAGHAVAALRKARGAAKKARVSPPMPPTLAEIAPEWADMLERSWIARD